MDRRLGIRDRRPTRALAIIAMLSVAALLLAACGGGDEEAPGGGEGGGATTVQVTLSEWAVAPDPTTVPGGEVTFEVTNEGEETHEFVIIKSDVQASDLPATEDGSIDEEAEGLAVIDEIEDMAAGTSDTVTVDLEAGHYALLCNILETAEEMQEMEGMGIEGGPSHFQNGMRIDLEVER